MAGPGFAAGEPAPPPDSVAIAAESRQVAAAPDSAFGAALEGIRRLIRDGDPAGAGRRAGALFDAVRSAPAIDSLRYARAADIYVHSRDAGNLLAAELLALEQYALRIKLAALGPDHPEVARSVEVLGLLASHSGRSADAIPLFERALAIQERAHDPEHLEVARALGALANVLVISGEYDRAKAYLERALAIYERKLGAEALEVGTILNSLGNAQSNMRDTVRARASYERAIAIAVKALGPDNPEVARRQYNLARVLMQGNDYVAARPLLERALVTREKTLGPDHMLVGATLWRLGQLEQYTGHHERAMELLQRSLAIRERALGPDNPDVALSLVTMGAFELTDHPAAAESLYDRALAIDLKAFGPNHTRTVDLWLGLSSVKLARADTADALVDALRAQEGYLGYLRNVLPGLPEPRALEVSRLRAVGLGLALPLVAARGIGVEVMRAWDAEIQSRAIVLDEMAARHRLLDSSQRPEIVRLAALLAAVQQKLATLTVRGASGGRSREYLALLDSLGRAREDAERELALSSPLLRRECVTHRAGYDSVAAALPPGSALVAYARFTYNAPDYYAFVLRPGRGQPVLVDLGPLAAVDSLVRAWRTDVGRPPANGGDATALETSPGAALRRLVWDPLRTLIGGAQRVFVVPDGALSLVSLATLPDGHGGYLLESGPLLHYLSAERDLVAPDDTGARDDTLLAMGGPAFDDGSSFAALAPGRAGAAGARAGQATYRGGRANCSDFASLRFAALPATRAEAADVVALWNRRVATPGMSHRARAAALSRAIQLTGAEASEASFKARAPRAGALHLATHGFFLASNCAAPATGRGIGLPAEDAGGAQGAGSPASPLQLSGLVLAGANHRDIAGPGEEDGILTAEEIASLDLSGIHWAVLSACDTGTGEVLAGEGVLGLRRAFSVAGAHTLIMSLWSVEDAPAQAWMHSLYEARLLRHRDTAESVREASLGVLAARRSLGLSTHPFYWGAFVAAGDWR